LSTFIPNPDQASPTDGNWISVSIALQAPTSRGSIRLISKDAFQHPQIDPQFLSTEWDIGATIEAVKTLRDLFLTSSWKSYLTGPLLNGIDVTSDAAIEAYIRRTATTIKHPVSTCKISEASEAQGVVDAELLVKKTTGLRVVDASIIPFAVGGFPQAQVYMIAERGADLIKAKYGLH